MMDEEATMLRRREQLSVHGVNLIYTGNTMACMQGSRIMLRSTSAVVDETLQPDYELTKLRRRLL